VRSRGKDRKGEEEEEGGVFFSFRLSLASLPIPFHSLIYFKKRSHTHRNATTNNNNDTNSVHISALALLKMAMHAKSGGDLEVMGMLAGRAAGDAFVVLDAFALPVVGTETRVNAQAEANEYMIDFLETNKVREKRSEREREREERGRKRKGGKAGERLRGGRKNTLTFSHSSFLSFFTKKALGQAGEPRGLVPLAPGLRVLALRDRRRDAGWYFLFSLSIFFLFLRGLKLWDAACCSRQTGPSLAADQPLARGIPGTRTRHFPKSKHSQKKKKKLSKQTIQQQYNEPFLAIVVDPHRTAAAGRVELGAFRAYPQGYTPPPEKKQEPSSTSGRQTIPLSKVEDFGVHADRYYALETEVFKSPLDAGVLNALWRRYWGAALAASPAGSATTAALAAGAAGDVAGKLAACCEAAAAAARGAAEGSGRNRDRMGGYFGSGGFDFGGEGGGEGGGGGAGFGASASRRLARLVVGGSGGGGGGGIETPPSLVVEAPPASSADGAASAAAAAASVAAADAARAARAARRPGGEGERLSSAAADAARLAAEQAKALASNAVRASLFGGGVLLQARSAADAAGGETGGAAPMDP